MNSEHRAQTLTETEPNEELGLRALLIRAGIGLLVLMGLVFVVSLTLKEQIEWLGTAFVQNFGLWGVFGGVIFTDSFMLTHEPILLIAYKGGLGFWPVCVTACIASVLAGTVGWSLGRLFRRSQWLQAFFERYKIPRFLQRYGFRAVAVAAFTPIPFSAVTWASGASGVAYRPVFLGSLVRIPKVLFYFSMIVATSV